MIFYKCLGLFEIFLNFIHPEKSKETEDTLQYENVTTLVKYTAEGYVINLCIPSIANILLQL